MNSFPQNVCHSPNFSFVMKEGVGLELTTEHRVAHEMQVVPRRACRRLKVTQVVVLKVGVVVPNSNLQVCLCVPCRDTRKCSFRTSGQSNSCAMQEAENVEGSWTKSALKPSYVDSNLLGATKTKLVLRLDNRR